MKEKIQRTFVREEAYFKLRDWILDGTFEPGMQLKDKELAAQLGVSRTPIREALLRLEGEGLIQTKPNCSTHVSAIDFEGALHLYSIVGALERLALSQAFEAITEDHIRSMQEMNECLLQKMKARDRLASLSADHDFHSVYVKLAQNKELENILSDVKNKLRRLDLYYFDKIRDAEISYEEHQQILQALKQRDLSQAICAVEKNWKNSFSRFNIEGL